jgi:hypothetical protein
MIFFLSICIFYSKFGFLFLLLIFFLLFTVAIFDLLFIEDIEPLNGHGLNPVTQRGVSETLTADPVALYAVQHSMARALPSGHQTNPVTPSWVTEPRTIDLVVVFAVCSTSMVVEDIEPLNDEDPGVVPASITAVSDVDRNLPFTTLGEGDNKVSMFFCC